MNVALLDPFESNIPSEITHSLIEEEHLTLKLALHLYTGSSVSFSSVFLCFPLFAAAAEQSKAKIRINFKGNEYRNYKGSESTFTIKFHPDGKLLAAGTRDGRVLIWDLQVYSVRMTLNGHVGLVGCLDWHSITNATFYQDKITTKTKTVKSDLLVTGSHDWNVIIWSTKDGSRVDTIRFSSPVLEALLQPQPSNSSSKDQAIPKPIVKEKKTSNRSSNSDNPGPTRGPGRPRKSPDSGAKPEQYKEPEIVEEKLEPQEAVAICLRMAVIAQGQKPILLEKVEIDGEWSRKYIDLPDDGSKGKLVACSAQFTVNGDYLCIGTNRGALILCSPVNGDLILNFKVTPSSIVKQIGFSPSGKDMIINSTDRIIRTYSFDWDDDDEPDIEPEGKFMDVVEKSQWLECCISSDGEYVIAARYGGDKHELFIWEKNSGVLTKQLNGPLEGMTGMCWHPSRPVCATISGQYGFVYLWRHTPQQKFSAYEPTFIELEDNQDYSEREDEFDIIEDDVKDEKIVDMDMELDVETIR